MIVVDTTVLSNLARADRLSLLEALYGQVLVPSQVHDEILRGIAAGYDVLKAADESTEAEWMAFENRPERTLFKSLLGVIGYGEAAGIAIAKERDLLFFSDDRKARRVAQDQGVEISGTLGMLKLAVEEGMLSVGEADEVLNQMVDGGYYSPIRSIKELLEDGDGT
jgi:predicted nucleic acid-binding protein